MHGEKGPLLRLVRDQRVAFLLVGGTNTVIGTVWFITFQLLIQSVAGYMAVLFCAHVASVLCAFVLYRHFVFGARPRARTSPASRWSTSRLSVSTP